MANLSLFFAGNSFRQCARARVEGGSLYRHLPIETYDSADVRLVTEEGPVIRWSFTHADYEIVNPIIRLEAEHGMLHWLNNGRTTATNEAGQVQQVWPVCTDEEARREMLRSVIAHAAGGPVPICDARFAMAHGRLISQISRILPMRVVEHLWGGKGGVFENLRKDGQTLAV